MAIDIKKVKPGTRLRVSNAYLSLSGSKEKIVTVDNVVEAGGSVWVKIKGSMWSHALGVFSQIIPERDKSGRFVAPKNESATRNIPKALKRGALYAVKRKRGYQIAHLRAVAHDDFLVFSRHKKPFLARRNQVALATKEEVTSYLNEK